MSSVRRNSTRRYQSAVEWPAWTDELRFTITDETHPSPEDRAWAAANLNGEDHHTGDPTPIELLDDRDAAMRDAEAAYYADLCAAEDYANDIEAQALELAAEEAEAMDRLEHGHPSI
ncbi:hypothetical protein AB1L88_19775 [Tautonia sp. JC769]|uniref:hypothetical protein n=1 Tax=Tautonia sp. JC769 TaxID=3232135 RepID=UPI003457F201